MPNTTSAKKALRQSQKRYKRNQAQKVTLKKAIKEIKRATDGGDEKTAKGQLANVYKKLDKAAKTNLLKKNKASRLKSRLAKRINRVGATKK